MSSTKTFKDRLFQLYNGFYTQDEFAKYLGVSRQTVGHWLNGNRQPSADQLISVSKKCGKSTDWLLGIAPDNQYSSEESIRAASFYTGLSHTAIEALHTLNESEIDENKRPLHFLNVVLGDAGKKDSSTFPVFSLLSLADQYITAGEIKRRLDAREDYSGCKTAEEFQTTRELNEFNRRTITIESSEDLTEVLTIAELYKEYKMQLIKNELERYRKESINEVQA